MKTKTLFLLFILLSSVLFTSCIKQKERYATAKETAVVRTAAAEFLDSLKSVLFNEMKKNGIVRAAAVCSDTALFLTNEIAKSKGIYIKRVSMKSRNPSNYPDKFEKLGLSWFEDLLREKKLNESSEYTRIAMDNGKKFIRYMKPIIVQGPCLNCHGDDNQIPDDVKILLAKKYSNDKAMDYKIGDLRGAVSVKKIINR